MRSRRVRLALVAAILASAAAAASAGGGTGAYRLALARLVSPELGLIALDPAGGALTAPPRLLATTASGARFASIGPRLPRYSLVDDVYFLDREHGWLSVWNAGNVSVTVYRTSDGGARWRGAHVTVHTAGAGAVATLQFLGPRTGWLVDQQPTAPGASLYATVDGGARWRLVDGDLPEVAPVVFTSPSTAWQAGGLFARFLERSRDGGRTWARVPLPVPAVERSAHAAAGLPAASGDVLLVPVTYLHPGRADLAVYRSTDGGDRWTLAGLHEVGASTAAQGCSVFSGLPAPLAVSLAGPSTWWVAVNRAGAWFVDRTADAGATWQTRLAVRARSIAAYCPPLPSLQALDAGTAWLTVAAGRTRELLVTGDGGAHWRRLRPPD